MILFFALGLGMFYEMHKKEWTLDPCFFPVSMAFIKIIMLKYTQKEAKQIANFYGNINQPFGREAMLYNSILLALSFALAPHSSATGQG